MAVPLSVTTKNLSGSFATNKQFSGNSDELLRLQGLSWAKRSIAKMLNIILSMKHRTDDDGVEHVDMEQKVAGGITAASDHFILDWQERTVTDSSFGSLTVKTRRVSPELIENEFLKAGWSEDTVVDGVIHNIVSNDPKNSGDGYTWESEQVWGFQVVDGERRYVRLVSLTSSGKTDGPFHFRGVYDYSENKH
ncbi:hypothetical protein F5J12DRAFT_892291 [Pisolithus orientalis]|uniref:uncharacterized protein n=1 Tax=Pisolithus orientalis TaxID=936130 RepID=UPI002225824B|nr:uncharacterized protein F5J12DRAFT_892291 [Pisolithus orientalis]KAI6008310.1 hypothetical protein F5J12DRAFT_892291 [Pisolithus orientalis]